MPTHCPKNNSVEITSSLEIDYWSDIDWFFLLHISFIYKYPPAVWGDDPHESGRFRVCADLLLGGIRLKFYLF